MIPRTSLDVWAKKKIGAGTAPLTRELISSYQLHKLQEIARWAYHHSSFYRRLLAGFVETEMVCLDDLCRLPFTTDNDIKQYGLQFLCVSQSDISRVVTLESSGTTGPPKRLYFTPADQKLTVEFFQYGMDTFTAVGDKVLILLPGERPGGVGALLATAVSRLDAQPIHHGLVHSIPETLALIGREKIDCLVGIPAQVLALARYTGADALQSFRPKNVLLSTDYVSKPIVAELRNSWGCEVFEHYGMTEMGLGGGTGCAAHAGYHLHEADFYFEIIDPLTGRVVPDGQEGEVVITTLTRQGMPLIRYRTGDISRLLLEPCSCGSALRRLAPITRRKEGGISLGIYGQFTMADLDENLFAVAEVVNFTAAVDCAHYATSLKIAVLTTGQPGTSVVEKIHRALAAVPAIYLARQSGNLTVNVKAECCGDLLTPSAAKRAITEWK